MLRHPKVLLRGLIKLVVVVAAATLAGAGLGVGLAKVSGHDTAGATVAATPTTAPSTTTTGSSEPSTSTIAMRTSTGQNPATATKAQGTANPDVDVAVLSARLGTPSNATGHARVSVQMRVTNRASTPVQITTAVLMSGDFAVPLDYGARAAAGAILQPIAARASATGRLRFTTTPDVALRLMEKPMAHVRIADRTVPVDLAVAQPGTTTTTTG